MPSAPAHPFNDGLPWYENALDWIAEEGLVSGYPDGSFRGTTNISRAQLTNILYLMAGQAPAWDDEGADVPDIVLY